MGTKAKCFLKVPILITDSRDIQIAHDPRSDLQIKRSLGRALTMVFGINQPQSKGIFISLLYFHE